MVPSVQKNKLFKTADIAGSLVPAGSKVHIINLGCARNTVDSQQILGALEAKGNSLVALNKAETVIINTCSFINAAKQESVDTIFDVIDLKKKGQVRQIIVAGCLSERYGKELLPELKDVDAFVGVAPLVPEGVIPSIPLKGENFNYVKICESCYNTCSFCAIPLIKGRFVSRRMESVIAEVRSLDQRKVKEINLIGQDITAYGMDLYRRKALGGLLQKIVQETLNIEWIRLLYTFPGHITAELIEIMAQEPRICKYLDVPLQHISDRILAAMKRKFSSAQTRDLLLQIRKKLPTAALRTTFIVGFPGETDKDFGELLAFVKETRFDRLGVFMYSREEGTAAYSLKKQVPDHIKQERYDHLMQAQQKISHELQAQYMGKTLKVLIDERDKSSDNIYIGRTEYDAPEADGNVFVHSSRRLKQGEFVQAQIIESQEYDLIGKAS